MSGALTGAMIDRAIPPRCMAEARAKVKARAAGWIGKTVDIIQHHNKSIETEGNRHRCQICGSDASLIWETP